jgi:hypothetical protein
MDRFGKGPGDEKSNDHGVDCDKDNDEEGSGIQEHLLLSEKLRIFGEERICD